MDHARGLSALTTVRASQAAGRQRAGRAGREAPGAVYRCWEEAEDGRLPRFPVARDQGGRPDGVRAAGGLLGRSGRLRARAARRAAGRGDGRGPGRADGGRGGGRRGAGHERGVRMSRLGLHPRLARALLDGGRPRSAARRAAEVVALLSEEPPREYGDDLAAAWRAARRGGDGYAARWRQEVRRLGPSVPGGSYAAVGGRAARRASPRTERRPSGSWPRSRSPSGWRGPGATGAFSWRPGPGRARDGSRCAGRRGSPSPSRTGPWVPAHARVRLGAVIDEDTARLAAGHRCTPGRGGRAGPTGTWWRGTWSGWGPSSWRCVR